MSAKRIAIVDNDRCKPKKCGQQCRKSCPVVQLGKLCIEVTPSSRVAKISEGLCIGCGMCARVCPFNAIKIVNLPHELLDELIHTYGSGAFKLYRLPQIST